VSGMAAGMLRHGRQAAAAVLPVALIADLGIPALGTLVFLAALAAGMACWVIASPERTERVSRLLLASRGDTKCLPAKAAASRRSGLVGAVEGETDRALGRACVDVVNDRRYQPSTARSRSLPAGEAL
jgi:hypothetical protein